MSEYDDVTDCPTCPQLATDRDDALREIEALRAENARLRAENADLTEQIQLMTMTPEETKAWLDELITNSRKRAEERLS